MPVKYVSTALLLALVVGVGVVLTARQAGKEDPLMAKAKAIHAAAITIDTHVDIGGANYATPALDPGPADQPQVRPAEDEGGRPRRRLPGRVRRPASRPDETGFKPAYDQAITGLDAVNRLTTDAPGAVRVRPQSRRRRADRQDRQARRPDRRRERLPDGRRPRQPEDVLRPRRAVHDARAQQHNQLADSSTAHGAPMHNGLSDAGQEGRRRDEPPRHDGRSSRTSRRSRSGTSVEISKAPIIESHSGCKAISPCDRNLTDDQLKALAKNGGVIQIVALASYLKAVPPERAEADCRSCARSWACRPAAAGSAGRAARSRRADSAAPRPRRR